MLCGNCGTENDNRMICHKCGNLLINVYDNSGNVKNDVKGNGQTNKFGKLKETNWYLDKENVLNAKLKDFLYQQLILKRETSKKEKQEEIKRKAQSKAEEIFKNSGYKSIRFTYQFRKRFKALEPDETVGIDYVNQEKIPQDFRDKYDFCGDYILFCKNSKGCLILLTDRKLYLNDIAVELQNLQEVIYFDQAVYKSGEERNTAIGIFERDNVQFAIVPRNSIVENFVCELSTALTPFRDPGYKALSDTNGVEGYCSKCHSRNIKGNVILSCNKCGNTNGRLLFRSMGRKLVISSDEAVINQNLPRLEKEGKFKDEEDWLSKAKKVADEIMLQDMRDKADEKKQDMMFCAYCGKSIKRSAKFCSFCGKKVSP